MFKSILKCSIFVLLALTVAACHQNDDHRYKNTDNVNCYHHGGNVNCHRS